MGEPKPAKRWKRPVLILVATAPILVAVLAFVFMARTEMAFEEGRCPYPDDGEARQIAPDVQVREDTRRCQPSVEEHRWVLLREGRDPLELGRRRLDSSYYQGDYEWTAEVREGRVVLEIRNPGQPVRRFREPLPDGGPP